MYSDMYGPCGHIYSLTMKKKSVENVSIELKYLSEISDQDAIDIAVMCDVDIDEAKNNAKKAIPELVDYLSSEECPLILGEFLRFRGYALPWMGLSVNEMVEAGWIKLK